MEEIITVKGKEYKITTAVSLTSQQRAEVIRQITQECDTCGALKLSPATGCGQTKKLGTNLTFRCTASGGTGNYVYQLWIIGSAMTPKRHPATGYTTDTTHDFVVPTSDFTTVPGTFHPSFGVYDDCPSALMCNDPLYDQVQYCDLIIAAAAVNTITISGCDSAINVGGTCTLTASCLDQFGDAITCPTLTWTSRNTAIATVNSSGVVTGVSGGTTAIYCTGGGKTSNDKSVTVCGTVSCTLTIQ